MNRTQKLNYSIISSKTKNKKCNKELTINLAKKQKNYIYILHQVLTQQLLNLRKGNAHTKTRNEVRGGGKKPWKQKGTGRARAGSNRSPLWRGGGVVFGPRTKQNLSKINRKEKQLALRILIENKLRDTVAIENFIEELDKPSTKKLKNILQTYNINTRKQNNILIIVSRKSRNLYLATRNLKNIELLAANHLNIVSLLKTNQIVIDEDALNIINDIYNEEKYKRYNFS
uniref:Large ribosomal subunit protein uL4c n=1 Tax=Gracilaria edulis TaxID=172966 RepID=A0A6C0A8R8_9FLOR|nr:50S ribosomal protein L4 [Gracilaria edulis]QHS70513.1 50S ribosomal protein L4 [Gracilaria edulis]UAD85634.1 ribosomal protein L4 [Gracilaria edulis]